MIIDLSVTVNEDTPVYPGDPTVKIEKSGVLSRDGYCDHVLTIGTHVGTHIDAPLHMIDGGSQLKDFEISRFAGRGRYIDVRDGHFSLDLVRQVDIQEGDIVLFHTGLSEIYGRSPDYFEKYPQITEEVAQYLIDQKISMVGIDMCSPDHPDFPIHKMFLKADVLIIENLTNLEKLRNLEFKVYALPIKLEQDGAPARVIAEVL